MRYYSRKWIRPEDLNANNTLFGGSVLRWIDEEAAIFVSCQLEGARVVTKFMSEIDFVSSARNGDVIEIGTELVRFGKTSVTVACQVRNKFTQETIVKIDKIVYIMLDENGNPAPHGRENEPVENAQEI